MFLRRIKILVLIGLAFGVSLIGALWTSQWWLPVAAPSLLGFFDIQVEASRSAPGGRWRVEGLRFEKSDAPELRVEYVELPGLWGYGKALLDGRRWKAGQRLEIGPAIVRLPPPVEDLEVEQQEAPRWVTLFSDVNGALATTAQWLPPVSVASLRLEQMSGTRTPILSGKQLHFDGRVFAMEVGDELVGHPVSLEVGLDPEGWKLEARAAAMHLQINARAKKIGKQVLLRGEATRVEERVEIDAVLTDAQMLPAEASVSTAGFALPDELLPAAVVPQLSGLRVEQADIRWAEGVYRGQVRLGASAAFEGESTPVRAAVELDGDIEQLRLSGLEVDSTWLQATLDAPLVLAFRDASIAGPAKFRVSSDLAQQSFFDAGGTLRGTVEAQASGTLQFDLAGDALRFGAYGLSQLELEGLADRSKVEIESMRLKFPEDAGGQIDLSGSYQFKKSYLEMRYEAMLEGSLLQKYAGFSWIEVPVELSGQIRGDPLAPEVSGRLESAVVDLPGLQPAALEAEYRFQAPGSGAMDLVLRREAEQIELALEGSLERGASIEGRLQAFAMRSEAGDVLRLKAPVSFRLPFAETMPERFAAAEIGSLEIDGSGGRGSLGKAARGPLELRVSSLSLNRFNGWLETSLPDVTVREMDSTLSALSPYVRGRLDLSLEEARPLGLVRVELANMELGTRLSFDALGLSLDEAAVLQASGGLPLSISGPDAEGGPRLRVAREGELDFRAETLTAESLSALIAQWTGLGIDAPELKIDIGGTVATPVGQVRVRAGLIDFDRFRFGPDLEEPLPALRDFEIGLSSDGQRLQVERLEASIREGGIQASGEWALPAGLFSDLAGVEKWEEHLLPDRFELSFTDWKVENWTPYLPGMLRRSGLLSGALRYRPEKGLGGAVTFGGLALRPTQNFPAVDSISGEFRVDDQLLTLSDASARIGGSPVSMQGKLDVTTWPRATWMVGISGENVPIVRRPDIILRSDLEVALKSGVEPGSAELSGRLGLRSSTMLVEFDPLSPPTESGPATRPPFFAIEEAPFSQWDLNLRIEGERFLRIRSPYFQSLLSAGFDLSGTLGQPILIGGVRLEEGHLSFPGAKLSIDSGEAYIEAAAPNTLRLDVAGTARTGTHVISMEVGGSLSEPQIQFDASPPLQNSSIIRLLSTGSATGGGGGSVGLYLGRGLLGAGGMGERLSDRLTIDVGQETTRSGRSAFGLRYDFNEKWSLQSEYDVYDSYNMDLLWTIFKR